MNKLIAFHGKKSIKDKYIARVKAHQKADEIVKGKYWENGKGCAVGCTIEGSEHVKYETELGIPEILARLEDGLFEEMSNVKAKKFPLKFLEAIPVGADLSKVFAKFVIWEWEDKKHGLSQIKEITEDKELVDCCEKVVALYKRFLKDEKIEDSEWLALENLANKIEQAGAGARARARTWAKAWAGAGARARARTWAKAWAGARAGARAGAWARARAWAGARARAWAKAWAGARAGAWARAEYEKQIKISADKLLELLKESK